MALFNQEITVLRATQGDYVDGLYTSGDRIQLTVKGSITTKNQMALYKNLEYDIELKGSDIQGLISVLTLDTELKTLKNNPKGKADIVIYNNSMYEVLTQTGLKKSTNIQHYRYIARYLETLDDGVNEPVTGNPFRPNKINISLNSEVVGTQNNINFITSDGIDINIIDNEENNRIDVNFSLEKIENIGESTINFNSFSNESSTTITGQIGLKNTSFISANIISENDDILIHDWILAISEIIEDVGFKVTVRTLYGTFEGNVKVKWKWEN